MIQRDDDWDYAAERAQASPLTRATILDTAKGYVTKDRAADHGDMENNFGAIAAFWSTYLSAAHGTNLQVRGHDVAAMMQLLKIARSAQTPAHLDHWIDGAGYAACGGELAAKLKKGG